MRKIVTHNLSTDLTLVTLRHGDYYLSFTESGEFIEQLKYLGFDGQTKMEDNPNKPSGAWWKSPLYYTVWSKKRV